MKIIDDIILTLNLNAVVRDIRQGPFQTAVLTRNCGLASTPHDAGPHHDNSPVKEAGRLLEKNMLKLVQMANSSSPSEAAIGMATINSLMELDEKYCLNFNAGDLIVEKGKDKKVAIVGHFPFIPKLRSVAKELWVIEQRPQEGDFAETEAGEFIPQADVVGITGTAFTNHTIESLLTWCNPKAYVVILGGTTPLSPVLFDYGVAAISGTKVIDSKVTLRCVCEGAIFRQLRGIRLLTMQKERR